MSRLAASLMIWNQRQSALAQTRTPSRVRALINYSSLHAYFRRKVRIAFFALVFYLAMC